MMMMLDRKVSVWTEILLGSLVLLLLLCCTQGTDLPRIVVVPHDAEPGTLVHNLHMCGVKLKDRRYSEYFALIHDGSLITLGNISSLVDDPVTLEVQDNLLPDTHLLTLEVRVLNTHELLWFPSDYNGRVQENSQAGTVVTGLEFITAETDSEKPVIYRIVSGNGKHAFGLKNVRNKGRYGVAIVVNSDIDREEQDYYNITIQAAYSDMSDQTKIAIPINVLDINDNAPYFTSHLLTVSLSTDVPTMTKVAKVKASDPDESQIITYFMNPDNPFFFVAPKTGELFVVYGTEEQVYNLSIYAIDNGKPPLISLPIVVQVDVRRPLPHIQRIMDIVNTEPEHRQRIKRRAGRTFDVPENKTGIIGTLQRREKSERFHLEEENDYLAIDPATGDISLKFGKQFDYEEQTVHTFNVIITEGSNSEGK